MNPIFEIWSPYFEAGGHLTFDVTAANLPQLNHPPEDWIKACLASIHLDTRVLDWRVRPSRCNYYSNAPGSDDWQDRWRLTWTFHVRLQGQKRGPSHISATPQWFDQHDPTWSFDDYDDLQRGSYAILFTAAAADAPRVAERLDTIAGELASLGCRDIEQSTHAFDDGWLQGRIRFPCAAFASRVSSFDHIIEELRGVGFVTDWGRLAGAR